MARKVTKVELSGRARSPCAVPDFAFWRTLPGVSVVPHPDEPTALTVLPPEEALKRAQVLPTDDEMAIEGLTEDEWKAFDKALSEQ
jgi:hypothetical protein